MAFDASDPLESFKQRLRRARPSRGRPPRPARASRPRASRSTPSTASSMARTSMASSKLTARLAACRCRGRRQPGEQRGLAAVAERLPAALNARPTVAAPPVDSDGRARRDAREGGRGRRCARERERRADGDPHAVRARAQPDRRVARPIRLSAEDEVRARAARRRRGDRIHHLQRSFCPRLAFGSTPIAATTRTRTRASKTSSRRSAIARTA